MTTIDSAFTFTDADVSNPLGALTRPDVHADPYPYYDHMRSVAPVAQDELGMWFITKHEYVNDVFNSSHTTTQANAVMAALPMPDDLWTQYYDHELLFTDGERHMFLRSFANSAFKPRRVKKLRPQLEADVASYLDRAQERGEFDLVSDLAHPFAILTVIRMIGIDDDRAEDVTNWSSAMGALLDVTKLLDPDYRAKGIEAFQECIDYIAELMQQRKADPRDDVISDFVATLGTSGGLSYRDIMGIVIRGMINAGHATTTSQIGNNMLALLDNRDQLDKLVANPGLAANAIEELFRYDPAIQMSPRCAAADMVVGGQEIKKGELMWLFGGAANRDPQAFDRPNELDIERTVTGSLASGNGDHYCLGAVLARLETEVALTGTLQRFGDLELKVPVADLPRDSNITVRCATSMPLDFQVR